MMNLLLTLLVLAFPVYAVTSVVLSYSKAEGTKWERILAAFRNSASLFWTRLNAVGLILFSAVGEIATWVGAPGVEGVIKPFLEPKYMLVYMLVVLFGAEVARRRTLK